MFKLIAVAFVSLTMIKLSRCSHPALEFDLNSALSLQKICAAADKALISHQCMEQLRESCNNKTVLRLMIDAESKFPYSGLSFASRWDLGNFDECIRIRHDYQNGTILGKYCTNGLLLYDLTDIYNKSVEFRLATCFPNGCTANDYHNIFQIIYSNNFPGVFNDSICTTNEPKKLTTAAIVIIAVFIVFIILMATSTIYDYYLRINDLRCTNQAHISFSVITNGRKLFLTTRTKDSGSQILIFHGMKLISAVWTVFAHTVYLWKDTPVLNEPDLKENETKQWYFLFTHGGMPVPDTFFFISGFLLAYNYLTKKNRSLKVHLLSLPRFYLHRYLRIAPALYMIYFVVIHLLVYMADGPLARLGCELANAGCEKRRLWAFFLFLENYHDGVYCLFHIWYLSVDMQLYVLCPIVIIPLAMKLKQGDYKTCMLYLLALDIIFAVVSIVVQLILTNHDNYADTHPRAVMFITGIMMATYLRERKDEPFIFERYDEKYARIANIAAWTLTLIFMYMCCMIWMYGAFIDKTIYKTSLYPVLGRPLWAVSLCWILYACQHGYGGIVTWILTRPIMQVGGKLSYSIYIVQILPIYLHHNTLRKPLYVSAMTLNVNFWAIFIFTVLLAFFWNLAFEAPIAILEKSLFDSVHPVTVPEPHKDQHGSDSDSRL